MCRIEWSEPWTVYRERTRKARKPHICYECGRRIAPGESYHDAVGLSAESDRWESYRLCEHCMAAGEWLRVMCGGWCYGGILEELQEHWDEEFCTRSVGLLVLIVRMGDKWRDRHGVMVPPPEYAKTVAQETKAGLGKKVAA